MALYRAGHLKIDVFSFIETALTLMSVLYLRIVTIDSAGKILDFWCKNQFFDANHVMSVFKMTLHIEKRFFDWIKWLCILSSVTFCRKKNLQLNLFVIQSIQLFSYRSRHW